MSEHSIDDDINDDLMDTPLFSDAERYAFVLQSTLYVHCKQQLLGTEATLQFGPASFLAAFFSTRSDIDRKTFTSARITANAYIPPAMVIQGMNTQRPNVFPPPSEKRLQRKLQHL